MVWPFVFDAGFTILRRARRGEPLMQAHRSHLYQRLVSGGWRHATVAWLYLVLGAICATAAAGLAVDAAPAPAAAATAVATAAVLWGTVTHVERRAAHASVTQTPEAT
jgi:hypothetical protein